MTPDLISETAADGVVLLRLNRPERRNALAMPLLRAIADALGAATASLRQATELPLKDHLLSARRAFVGLLGGAEKGEGITAFSEKRPAAGPSFES